MFSVVFSGDISELEFGLKELEREGYINQSSGGMPVSVKKGKSGFSLSLADGKAEISWGDRSSFFRALSFLVSARERDAYTLSEQSAFSTRGFMFDCSRNGVDNVENLKFVFRKAALMGINAAMLYTEDTYEVPGEPYFGYLRGAYTQKELRELDDYAYAFGIELIPCIQVLSHFERAFQYPCYWEIAATPRTIFVGEEKSYEFIEKHIKSVAECFRTKRIHIGMDEAHDMGEGQYLAKHGRVSPHDIIKLHLDRVLEITRKAGLEPMMWSDMFFRPDLGGYYSLEDRLSEKMCGAVPSDVSLVYWDYYHTTPDWYDAMLKMHERFAAPTVFAGGVWTWVGPAPLYDFTYASTVPALEECKKHGVKDVFATVWGDDGQECTHLASLYGIQLYAELSFSGRSDREYINSRFLAVTGTDGALFENLSRFDRLDGEIGDERFLLNNISRAQLYEDPLLLKCENDLKSFELVNHYALLKKYYADAKCGAEFKNLFYYYECLAEFLSEKARWRKDAPAAVRAGDRKAAAGLAKKAKELSRLSEQLRGAWSKLWYSVFKPYGFEIIESRIGAQTARFLTAADRMQDFADGTLEDIPELSGEKLPLFLRSDGGFDFIGPWAKSFSSCARE